MKFMTMDMELADRILPSICSISIISWINTTPVNVFHTWLNPECEIEEFFADRHGMTNEDLKNMPTLREKWTRIYDIMEGQMIFAHNANAMFSALQKRAEIDLLNIPDFTFASTASIAKRCFPECPSTDLQTVAKTMHLASEFYDSYLDAHTISRILLKAIEKETVSHYTELFQKVGYVGGKFIDRKKILVRPVFDKEKGIYIPQQYQYESYSGKGIYRKLN